MARPTWIDKVDRSLHVADRLLDRLRKVPRRRLDEVPSAKVPNNPFVSPAPAPTPAPAAAPAPTASLSMGDPGLLLQVFGRRTCVESGFAIKLLSQKSLPVRLIDIEDPDNVTMEPRLIKETKSYKTPYLFVRGRYIGDYQALEKLEKSKALDALLFEGDGGVKA